MKIRELQEYQQDIIKRHSGFLILRTALPIVVRNSVETAVRTAPGEISWIDYWRAMTGEWSKMLHCCSCGKLIFSGAVPVLMKNLYKETGESAEDHVAVGGHVLLNSTKYRNDLFVVPLCPACNSKKGESITLKENSKLVVMLYKEGSRNHNIPEEVLFKDSNIKYFLADRAALYQTVAKDLEQYQVVRASCWFHGRHYLVDALSADCRVKDIIEYINFLFYVERESAKRGHTPEQRLRFRLKYSQPIVMKIMKRLEEIHFAGNEYGELVHRAVNYILNDKDAFLHFLQNGQIEMHNNAIERCFRHIAIGRRNWLHSGSHFAAENIAFMYSLVESCKLNNVNFGEYIEDILTRIMNNEEADESFLPNKYVSRLQQTTQVA